MGNAVGKDDPIPVDVKLQTWHKMYPEYAKNISGTQQGGSLMQKIKHELINPLPGKPPRYDNVIIMVGEDQASMPIAGALMKAVNKFQGYEHVKVSLEVTPRGTGMSFTKLRNILKDPKATPEQQYALWAKGFDEAKLGKDWILHLMDITKKGMGVPQQPAVQPAPVVAERLSVALIRPNLQEATFKKSPYGRTAASQQRAKELLNPPKPLEPKKDEKDVEETNSTAIAHTVNSLENPPKVMQHRARRDQERDQQWLGTQIANNDKTSKDEWGNLKKEAMLPKSAFAGSDKNKLGSAGQLKGSMKRPARAGDLVGGGAEESIEREEKQRLDPSCWKGYRKQGTKMKGGVRVNNCVPVSEGVENIMDSLINKIIANEAIQNNKR
jgi:hypothetical protein